MLGEQHLLLRQAIESFPASRLNSLIPDSKLRYAQIIYGISSHDLYHAGQIQLVKRLNKSMS